jgi:hypothetical protein
MSHASRDIPSRKNEKAVGSRLATCGILSLRFSGSINKGRGRGIDLRSVCRDATGLLVDDGEGVVPGKGISRP